MCVRHCEERSNPEINYETTFDEVNYELRVKYEELGIKYKFLIYKTTFDEVNLQIYGLKNKPNNSNWLLNFKL